jgi:hypothetical protein
MVDVGSGPKLFDLSNQVAIVTGSGRGLGAAIARGLASGRDLKGDAQEGYFKRPSQKTRAIGNSIHVAREKEAQRN